MRGDVLAFGCFVVATLGFPLAVIGVILRLCEGSWGKARGDLGSTWFLVVGSSLCLPLVVYLGLGLIR
jgi:hypothetical protein